MKSDRGENRGNNHRFNALNMEQMDITANINAEVRFQFLMVWILKGQ